jgi:hypothetical protein
MAPHILYPAFTSLWPQKDAPPLPDRMRASQRNHREDAEGEGFEDFHDTNHVKKDSRRPGCLSPL